MKRLEHSEEIEYAAAAVCTSVRTIIHNAAEAEGSHGVVVGTLGHRGGGGGGDGRPLSRDPH